MPMEHDNSIVALSQHIALIKVSDVTNCRAYDCKRAHTALVELVVANNFSLIDLGHEARKYRDGFTRELAVLISAVGVAGGLTGKVYEGWSFAEIAVKVALRAGIDKQQIVDDLQLLNREGTVDKYQAALGSQIATDEVRRRGNDEQSLVDEILDSL